MSPNAPVASDVDMAIRTLWSVGRSIWHNWPTSDLTQIAICLAVLESDISREARAQTEGDQPNMNRVGHELSSLVLSILRWMDDLGLNPHEYMKKAIAAQQKFVSDV